MDAKRLFDSALFWVALGAGMIALGAVTGTGFVVIGAVALWWSLTLFMAHRHAQKHIDAASQGDSAAPLSGSAEELFKLIRLVRDDALDRYWSGSDASLPNLPDGKEFAIGEAGLEIRDVSSEADGELHDDGGGDAG
jgi:hypothetical protein